MEPIGRRPIVAGGNSNGDIAMLRFATGAQDTSHYRLLLLHDDAEREFDYTAGAEEALARADEKGWTVISIANDCSNDFDDHQAEEFTTTRSWIQRCSRNPASAPGMAEIAASPSMARNTES